MFETLQSLITVAEIFIIVCGSISLISIVFVIAMVVRGEFKHAGHQKRRNEMRADKEMVAWDHMLENGTFHYELKQLYSQYHLAQDFIKGNEKD
jgi:hypothetical protein